MSAQKTLVAASLAAAAMAAHKPDCTAFCTNVVDTCGTTAAPMTDITPPYTNVTACMTACEPAANTFFADTGIETNDGSGLAAGYNNTNTDTFYCRDYHLTVAKTDAASAKVHCAHTAAASAPCATDQCEDFCDRLFATCANVNVGWADSATCRADCKAAIPSARGQYGDAANNFGCRVYHLEVAKTTQPEVHCLHAAKDGGGICVDTAASFCALDTKACKDIPTSLYADCATEYAALPAGVANMFGAPTTTSGDSQACRQYHLNVAFNMYDAAVHCPHASENGGGVCVAPEPEPELGPAPVVAASAVVAVSAFVAAIFA